MHNTKFNDVNVLVYIVIGLLISSLYAPLSSATFAGENGKIAFVSDRDGDSEIYVMNADGTGVTQLTNDPASDARPIWSPDGSKIVFTKNVFISSFRFTNEIYVMNADGSEVTQLTNTGFSDNPTWSPDGSKIAFNAFSGGNNEIYVMNADGTGVTQLTNTGFNCCPTWSPDGTKLAFVSFRNGYGEIYTMNFDGTDLTQLTNSPTIDIDPIWSPDGTKIAFRSDRDGSLEIYTMNPDGSGVTRLTNVGPVFDLRWSPDGTKLAFISFKDNNRGLYVMNADGTGLTLLTTNAQFFPPAWSPDSTKIAFWSTKVVNNNLSHEIFVINADGTGETNLTNNPALDQHPDWQPLPVQTNNPPNCSTASPSLSTLWPPNHKFVSISISGITDSDGDSIILTITSIKQDEPTNGLGDGDVSPDGTGVGTDKAQVRAERSGLGDGRVYEISFTANDGKSGACSGKVIVGVPHNIKSTPIDSGVRFDSTS